MKRDKISVIVPVYNIEQYIRRCVCSILTQPHKNLEVILVDDGSADGSLGVMKRLAAQDDRIVVSEKEHSGALQSRLAGVKIATGEWIGFVDGDDMILPEMYERLLFSSCCNKLYKKELFDEALFQALAPEHLRCNEDFLMNYYLFGQARHSVYEANSYYQYYLQGDSATQSAPVSTFIPDAIRVREIVRRDVSEDDEVFPHAMRTYLMTLMECYSILRRQETKKKSLVGCCKAVENGGSEAAYGEKVQKGDGKGFEENEDKLDETRNKLAAEREYFYLLEEKQAETASLIVEAPEVFAVISDRRRSSGSLGAYLFAIIPEVCGEQSLYHSQQLPLESPHPQSTE